ncbi:Gypsy retrotransposon integrase-like protein 1 [Thecaphora frezii]
MKAPGYTTEDEARAATQLASLRGESSAQSLSAQSPAASLADSIQSGGTRNGAADAASPDEPAASSRPSKPQPVQPRPTKDTTAAAAKSAAKSTAAADRSDDAAAAASEPKARKRRRVVVACDTCRRKKVKCEGLPNPINTCNNCSAYNYRCTFSSEPDRSRGKYEILESKVETLLSALRSVAPHIAAQYEQGELTITGPSGGSAPPQNAMGWRDLHSVPDGEYDGLDVSSGNDAEASRERPLLPSDADGHNSRGSADHDKPSAEEAGAGARREADRAALIPDVEDGRPRYFGHSSTLSLFHSMPAGKQSRPPSPGPPPPRPRYPSTRPQIFDSYEARRTAQHVAGDGAGQGKGQSPSRTTPIPLHPTNSKEWIQLLRRKNTVAVGRDDLNTKEWLTRYTLPAADLVSDLLELYFTRLSPMMPIVHRPSLERDIATGRADKDVAFRGFVFTLLTIASRFSNDPRVYADPNDPDSAGDHFAAASRLYHQVYAASLINVQVMILTATFMHGAIGPGASWTVLGVAIRALQDIGLHQERAYRDFTPFDQEIRRRVFWSAFILDSIFSINMGRPPGLRLEDCDVKLPLDIDDEVLARYEHGGPIVVEKISDMPTVMSGFIHMIKLNTLVYDVIHTLYPQRWRQSVAGKKLAQVGGKVRQGPDYKDMAMLSKRLDQWVAEMPEHLRTLDSPYKLQSGLLQCGAHDVRLYILKPFLDHAALKKILHPQCSHHARECLKVVLELHEGGHVTDLVFIFQQALMSTATFMITVWHECRDAERLAEDNDLIEATLRTFSAFDDRYFSKIFRRAHRILRDIATRTIHTMTSDQRERVSRLLQRDGQPMPSLFAAPLLGLGPSARLMAPRQALPGSTAARMHGPRPGGDASVPAVTSKHSQLAGVVCAASSIIPSWSPWGPGAQSPAHRASIDYGAAIASPGAAAHAGGFPSYDLEGGDGSVAASSGHGVNAAMMATHGLPPPHSSSAWADGDGGPAAHPNAYPDVRGVMPLFTPASEDVGSTAHQLEELSWTDYFSKFLDEMGGANQSNGAPPNMAMGAPAAHDLPFAAGSPGTVSVAGGTPRRYAA